MAHRVASGRLSSRSRDAIASARGACTLPGRGRSGSELTIDTTGQIPDRLCGGSPSLRPNALFVPIRAIVIRQLEVIEQGAAHDPFGDKGNPEGLLIAKENPHQVFGVNDPANFFRGLLLAEGFSARRLVFSLADSTALSGQVTKARGEIGVSVQILTKSQALPFTRRNARLTGRVTSLVWPSSPRTKGKEEGRRVN